MINAYLDVGQIWKVLYGNSIPKIMQRRAVRHVAIGSQWHAKGGLMGHSLHCMSVQKAPKIQQEASSSALRIQENCCVAGAQLPPALRYPRPLVGGGAIASHSQKPNPLFQPFGPHNAALAEPLYDKILRMPLQGAWVWGAEHLQTVTIINVLVSGGHQQKKTKFIELH